MILSSLMKWVLTNKPIDFILVVFEGKVSETQDREWLERKKMKVGY